MTVNFKLISAGLAAALALASPLRAGVGDGPRAYQNAPVGTQMLTLNYMKQDSGFNIDGSPAEPATRIDADIAAFQYTRVTEISGQAAGLFAILPTGRVTGGLIGTKKEGKSQGLGDIQLGMVLGLTGSPALSPKEFAAFEPGFSLGLLTKLSLPTGAYSASKTVNLGTNRFAAQIGFPMSWNLGPSLRPGSITSVEFTPSMWIYGNNSSPTGGASEQGRKPLFNFEGHVTHDFSESLWGSLDAVYTLGGATRTDGADDNNGVESLGLGATIGFVLDKGVGLQFSYGRTTKANTDGLRDDLFRVKLAKIF